MEASQPKVIVACKDTLTRAKQVIAECESLHHTDIYMIEEEDCEYCKSIWSLASHEELEPVRLSPSDAKANLSAILCTSGSTNKPKGGMSLTQSLLRLQPLLKTDPKSHSVITT